MRERERERVRERDSVRERERIKEVSVSTAICDFSEKWEEKLREEKRRGGNGSKRDQGGEREVKGVRGKIILMQSHKVTRNEILRIID